MLELWTLLKSVVATSPLAGVLLFFCHKFWNRVIEKDAALEAKEVQHATTIAGHQARLLAKEEELRQLNDSWATRYQAQSEKMIRLAVRTHKTVEELRNGFSGSEDEVYEEEDDVDDA